LPGSSGKVAIVGVGWTPQGELPGQTPEVTSVMAVKEAMKDAAIDRSRIDGLIACKSVQGTSSDVEIGPLLGINPRYSQSLDYGSCSFSLHLAVQAIMAGMADTIVLCYGSDSRSSGISFAGGYGRTPPVSLAYASGLMHVAGIAALGLQRHRARYGTTEEQFGWIAVAQREWARMNPLALFREPLTIDQYLSRPYMVEPIRREDVTMISDGGVSVIVSRADRVGEFPHKPVYVVGMSEQTAIRGEYQPGYLDRTFLQGAAAEIWSSTGLRPSDINLLYIQDPTAFWVLQMLEYFGFAPIGQGGPWLAEGHTRPGGDLPVNTNGGQLSESYMWGWLHLVEAVRQLRGAAGPRQVTGAELAMYCSTQGWQKGGASIISTHQI
jgi:acetyl-CoA acetyltransferase